MLPQRWRRANLHVTQILGHASRSLDLPTCSNRAGDALDQLALPDDLVDERAANLQRPSGAVSWAHHRHPNGCRSAMIGPRANPVLIVLVEAPRYGRGLPGPLLRDW